MERHIDVGEFATKPHHTHACQHCGMTWRPAVVDTVGVRFLPGFKDPDDQGDSTQKAVANLGLGKRIATTLAFAGINTVGDLIVKKDSDLLRLPQFGRDSLRQVKAILDAMGLSLGTTTDGQVST